MASVAATAPERSESLETIETVQPHSYWTEFLDAEVRRLAGRYKTRALLLGSGQPLILLHGTGGHLENYARNIRAYSKRFRVVAIDLLWHSRSQADGFDEELFPSLLAQLLDVMSQLDITRAHIEGQSLGGWIAALFAAQYPDRVGRLVLTTPMGYAPSHPAKYPDFDKPKLRESTLATLRNPTWANVRARMERIVASPDSLTAEAIAIRHALYNDPALNRVQQRVMAAYFSDRVDRFALTDELLAQISAPTLIYWGDQNVTPPALGEHMSRQLPHGRFYSAANTGHWAQFENADEHNRRVVEFLLEESGSEDSSAAVHPPRLSEPLK